MNWQTFLETPRNGEHGVQVYDDVGQLASCVGRFLDAGFRAGAPAIAIATADHAEAFADALAARGWDAADLRRRGLLTVEDADATLAALMDGELPSPERFASVLGGLIDGVAAAFPGATVRAFGEMVDLLWTRGRERAAIALEGLWNDLARDRRFALLCAYQLDVFDLAVQRRALPEILGAHSHARPTEDPSRLAAAVDKALTDLAGPVESAEIYLNVAEQVPRGSLPRAQAVLTWLTATGNPLARPILEHARANYARSRP